VFDDMGLFDGLTEEHAKALRSKFAASSAYQGLLHHEPAALKALVRAAADKMRARGGRPADGPASG